MSPVRRDQSSRTASTASVRPPSTEATSNSRRDSTSGLNSSGRKRGPSHPETLRSVVNLGDLAAARHEWDRASRHYQRVASSLGKTVGSDHPLMALVTRRLGDVARAKGDYKAAQESYERSLEISERIGDLDDLADSHDALASLAIVSGDSRRAQDWYERALTIREQLGDRLGVAQTRGSRRTGARSERSQ